MLRKIWTNILRESTYVSVCLCWAEALKLYTWADKTPILRFYTYRVFGMIKSGEKYARGGNEFPPPRSFSLWSRLTSEISPLLPIKLNHVCASSLQWTSARGKSVSGAMRDWNALVHTSEWFGQKKQVQRRQKPTLWNMWCSVDLGSPQGKRHENVSWVRIKF